MTHTVRVSSHTSCESGLTPRARSVQSSLRQSTREKSANAPSRPSPFTFHVLLFQRYAYRFIQRPLRSFSGSTRIIRTPVATKLRILMHLQEIPECNHSSYSIKRYNHTSLTAFINIFYEDTICLRESSFCERSRS